MNDSWLVPDWPRPPGVHARVTTRWLPGRSRPPFDTCNLGDRCGDDSASVEANRAGLVEWLDLPASPLWLRQVHGIAVHDPDRSPDPAGLPVADAAVTRRGGQVLGVLTADCLPALFCAADGSEVAVAHAGWRGLAAGVLEATLAGMRAAPGEILAWLGPAIGPASYEVGEEVRQVFLDTDDGAGGAFAATRPGHWRCDLFALARRRLAAAGVRRIDGGGFDTFTDPRFFSYRRDARCGRFASLIWRE
ncbi:MAG TPA: peptidoglycan editing factor PgeF [Dokdonella sp.]|nr:peptidoglycan editing factor PgeF [Dokdonella sp.]